MDRCSSLGHPDAMVGTKQNTLILLISDSKGIFKITLYLVESVPSQTVTNLGNLFSLKRVL